MLYVINSDLKLSKPIGILIDKDPEQLSPIFWHYFNEIHDEMDILSMLSQIIHASSICVPKNNTVLIEKIKEIALKYISEDYSFYYNESAFAIFKWLVQKKIISPVDNIKLTYSNQSINILAIDCWIEYALYGDLSKLPMFPETDNKSYQKSYARLLINVLNNPSFGVDKIHIPHVMYDFIAEEFINVPCSTPRPNWLPSTEELMLFGQITNYLPEWFFAQILRSRTKSADIHIRQLYIISKFPLSIFDKYFEEIINFFEYSIKYSQNMESTAKCIRKIIPLFYDRVDFVISRLLENNTDVFNEVKMCTLLCIINELLLFSKNRVYFTDLYEIIVEGIPIWNPSLSFTKIIFNFFLIMWDALPQYQEEITKVAIASIYAAFPEEDSSIFINTPLAQYIYQKCSALYSVISADIVTLPKYRLHDSFQIIPSAVSVLRGSNSLQPHVLSFIFDHFDFIHSICPINSMALLLTIMPQASEKQLSKVISCLISEINRSNSKTYGMLFNVFQTSIKHRMSITIPTGGIHNMDHLPEDVNFARLILQTSPFFMPMILMSPNIVTLLLEYWALNADPSVHVAIRHAINPSMSINEERSIRLTLYALKISQPELRRRLPGWIERDFSTDTFVSQKVEIGKDLHSFLSCYPLSKQPVDDIDALFNAILNYGKYNSCKEIIEHILHLMWDQVKDKQIEDIKILKFMLGNDMKIKFTNPPKSEIAAILSHRLNQNFSGIQIKTEHMLTFRNDSEAYEATESETFSSKFLSGCVPGSISILKRLALNPLASVQSNFISHVPSFIALGKMPDIIELLKNDIIEDFLQNTDLTNPILSEAVIFFVCSIQVDRVSEYTPKIMKAYVRALECYPFSSAAHSKLSYIVDQSAMATAHPKVRERAKEIENASIYIPKYTF